MFCAVHCLVQYAKCKRSFPPLCILHCLTCHLCRLPASGDVSGRPRKVLALSPVEDQCKHTAVPGALPADLAGRFTRVSALLDSIFATLFGCVSVCARVYQPMRFCLSFLDKPRTIRSFLSLLLSGSLLLVQKLRPLALSQCVHAHNIMF